MLTIATKIKAYQACVLSILLYDSEMWTPYAQQEHLHNSFPLHFLRRFLQVTWQDHIQNIGVLGKASLPSMFALLSQLCPYWIGHAS